MTDALASNEVPLSNRTIAWSVDGTTFRSRGPIEPGLRLGGYLAIQTDADGERLGQLLEVDVVHAASGRVVEGRGRMIDRIDDPHPFDSADLRVASTELLRGIGREISAPFEIGRLREAAGLPAVLDARGFNRHTFLCGQSGSGKTYSLGVLLERLIANTRLPIMVIDPNGDHVHLGRTRDDVDEATASSYRQAVDGIQVLRAAPVDGEEPLRVRFNELGAEGPAVLLALDPFVDPDEYNALVHLSRSAPPEGFASVEHALAAMRDSDDHVVDVLRRRVENLGVDTMSLWSFTGARTLIDRWVEDRPRVLIADTSGFESRRERLTLALSTLKQLWMRRTERRPMLLVVDEAHDVCPAEPIGPLQRHAVELFAQIAGEGRKYGIHLLLASQRPDKLPANVLSQCDNLLLMRVNSAVDRQAVADRFGFAPPGLVELAGTFGLGEALIAGPIARTPFLARIGTRITPEGGADVPTDWAS